MNALSRPRIEFSSIAILLVAAVFSMSETVHAGTSRLAKLGEVRDMTESPAYAHVSPDVAYNSINGEYMLVWQEYDNGLTGNDIYARRFDTFIEPLGSTVPVMVYEYSQSDPVIAYNPDDNQYLVVWYTQQAVHFGSRGRRLEASGEPIGGDFLVGSSSEMALLYNPAAGEYFHTARAFGGSPAYGIYGQRISRTGSLLGTSIPLSSDPVVPNGGVGLDTNRNRYLAAWGDQTTLLSVLGRLVEADGSLTEPAFIISPTRPTSPAAGLAYDPDEDRYLVVFGSASDGFLRGRFVAPDGSLIGDDFVILSAEYSQTPPRLIYDPYRRCFIMVWGYGYDLFARVIYSDGTVSPDILTIAAGTLDDPSSPRVAHNPDNDELLVIWTDNRNPGGEDDVYGQRIAFVGACCDAGESCSNATAPGCAGNFYESLDCESILCSGVWCETAVSIGCGETQRNAMHGNGHVDDWAGSGYSYANALEMIYRVEVGTGGDLTVEMNYIHGPSNDLDLFLLGSCDQADGLAQSVGASGTELISVSGLAPGTYYIVVDGFNGLQDGSPHSLTVQCMDLCGNARQLVCGELQVRSVMGPGLVGSYCSSFVQYEGSAEAVYWVNLPDGGDLVIDMDYEHSASNDLDLFLLDTCMPDACLVYSADVTGHEQIRADELPPGTYFLVVDGFAQMQNGSAFEILMTCSAVDVPMPGPSRPQLSLEQNHPNPFNPQTTIAFDLPGEQTVNLHVYDVSGRLVDTLLKDELATAGRNKVVWRGRDADGRGVPAGVYFYRLEAGSYSETKRMVLVK